MTSKDNPRQEIIKISYKDKDYLAKQVEYKNKVAYPEYESAKILAANEGISLKAYDLMRILVNKIEK